MTYRLAALLVSASGLGGLLAALVFAPDYLLARGFPLDDAWIQAVYGRSLARSGMLAFNPGVPATGASSPLWAVALAALHLGTSEVAAFVLRVKLLGLSLHVVAALLLLRGLTARHQIGPAPVIGCAVAAFHPDLIAGSLSGTEVPLAAVMAGGLLIAARGWSAPRYGLLALAAPLARPELIVLCVLLPVLLLIRSDRQRLVQLITAAAAGNAAACALVGGYNVAVSGRPFAAAFYTTSGASGPGLAGGQVVGFTDLIGSFPIADSSILLGAAAVVAGRALLGRRLPPPGLAAAAAALISALVFCAVSFALVPPLDPRVLEAHRFVLPVVPLMVATLPVLLLGELSRLLPARPARLAQVAVLALLVLSVLVTARVRYAVLENDAQNVDDLQVSIGKRLAAATPGEVAWVLDGGAVRYFGNAFVVDLTGRNSAEILGRGAQRYLDDHPPRYIELVPTRSLMDADSGRGLTAVHFQPSTPYTVAGAASTQHHWLVSCDEPLSPRRIAVRDRPFPFRCAPLGRGVTAAR